MLPCVACEYDLGAVASPGVTTKCPECGREQTVERESAAQRPTVPALLFALTWPTVALCSLCALVVVLAFWEPVAMLCFVALFPASLAAFLCGWVVPILQGISIASQLEPTGRRRRRLSARLIALGLLANLFIGAAYLKLGFYLGDLVINTHMPSDEEFMD